MASSSLSSSSDWDRFTGVVARELGIDGVARGWSRSVVVNGDNPFLLSASLSAPDTAASNAGTTRRLQLRCAGNGALYACDLGREQVLTRVMQEGAGIEPGPDQQCHTFAAAFCKALVADAPLAAAVDGADDDGGALRLELTYRLEGGVEIAGTLTLPCAVPVLDPHTQQLLSCLRPTCASGRVAADPSVRPSGASAASAAQPPSPAQPPPSQQQRVSPVQQQLPLGGGGGGAGAGAHAPGAGGGDTNGHGTKRKKGTGARPPGLTLAGKKRRSRATGFKFG